MSNIQPGILIKPVSFQTLARHCDVRRVLDGKIGRAGVKTGGFRNLRVQVPPIARRRQSHFAAPVKLRLRHPRPGITLLVRIVDAHRQVPSGAWRPFHKRGVRVGGGGQLLFLRQRPGWPTALGVGTSEDAHVLRQHIDPGVSRHETHPGNRPLRSEIQDEGRGHRHDPQPALDYVLLTHFRQDHMGEVAAGVPVSPHGYMLTGFTRVVET